MNYTVKRVKESKGVSKTHYATLVAPSGNVTGWDADPGKALVVDETTVARVRSFYEGKPAVWGVVTLEPVEEPKSPPPSSPPPPPSAVKKSEPKSEPKVSDAGTGRSAESGRTG